MVTRLKNLVMVRTLLACLFVFGPLLLPSDADAGVNYIRVEKSATDFTAAATTKALTLFQTRGTQHVWKVKMVPDVDFAGGAVSAATIQVGKSGATDKYMPASNVFTGVSNGAANAYISTAPGNEVGGTDIQALLTTTGANTSALTAGKVTFYIYLSPLI